MDSQNPRQFDATASTSTRMDAPEPANTSGPRHTPMFAETSASDEEPHLPVTTDVASAAESTVDSTQVSDTPTFPPIVYVPVITIPLPVVETPARLVPVLSIPTVSQRWEHVLEDAESALSNEPVPQIEDDAPSAENVSQYAGVVVDADIADVIADTDADAMADMYTETIADSDDDIQAAGIGIAAYEPMVAGFAERISDQPAYYDNPFALHERSLDGWKRAQKTIVVLLSLTLMVAVAIVGAVAATNYFHQSTRDLSLNAPTPTISSYSSGVVIQPDPENIAPTPEAPPYQIGAWVSSNAPSGGTVKVFVRVSHNVSPVDKVPVTLTVQVPSGTLRLGPTKTDAYGLATFTVRFGGVSGAPCFVTAFAKIGKDTLTAETVFVPL